jgi:sialidase-1
MAHILDNRTGTNTIAYSALEKLDNQNFAIAYETDNYSNIEFKVFNINTDYPYKATYLTDETNTIKAHVSRKGEALYSTGKFGNGLDFDGKTLLVLPNHQNLALDNSNYTINFWFKSTYDNGENEVLLWAFNTNSGLPALWTRLMSDTGYRTLYATGSIENFYTRTLSSLKSDGVWHMATIVRNGSDYQTFIDGVRYNSVNTNFGTASLNSSLYDYGILFGAKPINSALGYTEFYYGSLDEVKIYKRALSQAEINQLLVNGTVSNTNLVYHENFD